MAAVIDAPVRSPSHASTMACVGVCGYVLGLALPVAPPVDLPLLFLVVLAAAAAVTGLDRRMPASVPALLAVLGFMLARLLSSLCGEDAWRSLPRLAPFLPALLLFYVLSEWVESRSQIVVIYGCLTGAALVLGTTLLVAAWALPASQPNLPAQAVPTPLLVVRNDVTVVAVLAPLALALAALRPRRAVLLAAGAFVALLVAIIVVVESRTALLTAVVGLGAFVALLGRRPFGRHRHLPWLLLVAVATAALVIDLCFGSPIAFKLVSFWRGSGRLALWAAALSMFLSAPVLGHGPSSFVLHYRAHMEALTLPAWVGTHSGTIPWPHNLYLELLAEQGLLGLLAFVGLSAAGLVMLARIVRSRRDDVRRLGAGAGAALIAFLAAALVELSFIRIWVTVIFFTLLGLLTAISRHERGDAPC